ncbi:hypothetical protein B0J14DRAFT_326751 [Halenospora varia]|nr:hypothetical protein B0J14DRAFT_326751 [Halenospora varia]
MAFYALFRQPSVLEILDRSVRCLLSVISYRRSRRGIVRGFDTAILLSLTLQRTSNVKYSKLRGEVIVSQTKKSKKEKDKKKDKSKDTDTESVSSTASSEDATIVPPPPEPKKCPLRFILTGMLDTASGNSEGKSSGCPLRRVQLWHTIPLVLLAIINLLLVIVALLGLALYRIATGIMDFRVVVEKADSDAKPHVGNLIDAEVDDGVTELSSKASSKSSSSKTSSKT